MQDERTPADNWAQVRDRIDRGETGDKIPAEDPAASPLGTDAEAGGAGTGADDVRASMESQQGGAGKVSHPPRASAAGSSRVTIFLIVLGTVIVLAAFGAVLGA